MGCVTVDPDNNKKCKLCNGKYVNKAGVCMPVCNDNCDICGAPDKCVKCNSDYIPDE